MLVLLTWRKVARVTDLPSLSAQITDVYDIHKCNPGHLRQSALTDAVNNKGITVLYTTTTVISTILALTLTIVIPIFCL